MRKEPIGHGRPRQRRMPVVADSELPGKRREDWKLVGGIALHNFPWIVMMTCGIPVGHEAAVVYRRIGATEEARLAGKLLQDIQKTMLRRGPDCGRQGIASPSD